MPVIKAKSQSEALRLYHLSVLPHIGAIMKQLGVPFNNNKEWVESGKSEGEFYRKDERDRVHFPVPAAMLKGDRVYGLPQPIGAKESEYLFVRRDDLRGLPSHDADGNQLHTTIEGKYTHSEDLVLKEEHSDTWGWSVSATIEAQAGGGESSGGSYFKASLTTEFNGSSADSYGKDNSTGNGAEIPYAYEAENGRVFRVDQMAYTSKEKVPVTDTMTLDLAFLIVDWHELANDSPLKGNYDKKDYKDTRSDIICRFDSLDEFRTAITGNNREYPGFTKDYSRLPGIRSHYAYLMDPDHRKIQFSGDVTFNRSLSVDTVPRYDD